MRGALLVGLSILATVAGIAIWKRMHLEPSQVDPGSALAPERKDEIRRFWEVYRRATALKQQGDWEEAAIAYREALAINPRHEDALYYFGNASLECGRYADAMDAWRRLVEVNPLSSRAHIQLGVVHSCGAPGAPFDLDVAEAELQRAHAINREESGPLLRLGEVALLKDDESAAMSYLAAAARTNYKSVEAHYLSGYILWRRGEDEAALASLRKALAICRADTSAQGVAGEGDTRRKAAQPLLAESTGRRGLFGPVLEGLREWKVDEASGAGMNEEYARLQAAIREVRMRPD